MKNKEERFSATISELRQDNACLQERLSKEESEKLVNFQFFTFCCDIFFLFQLYFDFVVWQLGCNRLS
jgi:hypothetical protein